MNLKDLPIHYVYKHINPKTKECLYIGHGRFERAWRCTTSGENIFYGHRSKEHSDYLLSLQLEGYIPTDWVIILDKNLTKSEACIIEQEYIRNNKTAFNKPMGLKLLTINKEELEHINNLRNSGLSYEIIAKQTGKGVMTVWRVLNGKNKNNV